MPNRGNSISMRGSGQSRRRAWRRGASIAWRCPSLPSPPSANSPRRESLNSFFPVRSSADHCPIWRCSCCWSPWARRRAITSHGVPIDVFGLGFGSQPVLVGASRKRSCAYDRQQSRGRIPPRRCPRKASGDDGGLGAMVRAEGGERRRICSTRRNRVRTFVLPATLIDLVSCGTFDRTKPQLSEARLRE